MTFSTLMRILGAIALLTVILTYGWIAPKLGLPAELPDPALLRQWFEGLGAAGPAAIIGLMVVAILLSPIPSAPIALAAGALYGHFWGGLYVLAGAELGALLAFGIARLIGFDVLHRWLGDRLSRGLAGSQNFLMATVFVSRLLPFISFDIVSYAAGLTTLTFWRFAIATLAGIIPASFLLAHFGSELVASETDRILLALVFLGLLTAIPLFVRLAGRNREE